MKKISGIRVIGGLLFLLMVVPAAHAQRKNNFGTSIDFVGGVSNQVGGNGYSLSQVGQGVVANYSVYPSITLKSSGEHSIFDLNYTFGLDRYETDPSVTTTSHSGTASFNSQLSKGVHLRLTDTFLTTSDASTVNLLKGFYISPEGFQYIFEPQSYRRNSISNNAAAGMDIDLSKRSYLTFGASGSFRHYTQDASVPGYLYDQVRWQIDASYSHRRTNHQTLSAGYSVYQNNFQDLENIRSHALTLGLTQVLSPSINLAVSAGPSFTEKTATQKGYVGYVASAYLNKKLDRNRFSFYYDRRSGDSTGLGTATDSHQGGVGFTRALSRFMSLGCDVSAFQQTERSGVANDYWSMRFSGTLSRDLGRHWVASIGGSYQSNRGQQAGQYDLTYKRAFISFGYRLPGLRRSAR